MPALRAIIQMRPFRQQGAVFFDPVAEIDQFLFFVDRIKAEQAAKPCFIVAIERLKSNMK